MKIRPATSHPVRSAISRVTGARPLLGAALTAVSYAGAASQTGSDTAGTITLPAITGIAAGDLVLVVARNSANEDMTIGATNATLIGDIPSTAPSTMRSAAKLFRADTSSPSFTSTTATYATGHYITGTLIKNAAGIEAAVVQHSDANGTTPTFGAISSDGAGRLAVAATLVRGAATPQAVAAGWERTRNYASTLGDDSRIVIDVAQVGAGAVTMPAHFISALTLPWASYALVLSPVVSVPFAPTNVSATAGNAQATVSATPPTNTGGSAILDYRVTCSDGTNVTGVTSFPYTYTGLTNGTAVTFTSAARNEVGYSDESAASAAVTPTAVIITNGTFDTDTDWTKGAGWTIAAGTADINGGPSFLTQSVGAQSGAKTLQFTVLNFVGGAIDIRLYSAGTSVFTGTTRSANGTYSEAANVTFDEVRFFAASGTQLSIDDVSIT